MVFHDRNEAGDELAKVLKNYRGADTVIYGIARGGVIVAKRVAEGLGSPLDVVIVRKIGHPQAPEYAIAVVTESGELVTNQDEVARVDPDWFENAGAVGKAEAIRRRKLYRASGLRPSASGKTAILVDDGMATGLTTEAAVLEVRRGSPRQLVVAVPVASHEAVERLRKVADEVVILDSPAHFMNAVGSHYVLFPQVSDDEVRSALSNESTDPARQSA
jgi:putative phosphoribosyl transferase